MYVCMYISGYMARWMNRPVQRRRAINGDGSWVRDYLVTNKRTTGNGPQFHQGSLDAKWVWSDCSVDVLDAER